MRNLWVDDLRPAPNGWLWARSVAEAQQILREQTIACASLDHDLGVINRELYLQAVREGREVPVGHAYEEVFDDQAQTGYDLLYWLAGEKEGEERDHWPREAIIVHTMNSIGAPKMVGIVDRYGPYAAACRWQPAPEFDLDAEA